MPEHGTAGTTDRLEPLGQLLEDNPAALVRIRSCAADVSAAFREVEMQIEVHTRQICPDCTTVCCINRHSVYDYLDIVYLWAAGEELPPERNDLRDTEPCQHLGERGCRMRRPLRPYRCTWYFCTPLVEHMLSEPMRRYRAFIRRLEDLTRTRECLKEEFEAAVRRHGKDPDSLKTLIARGPSHALRGCRSR